MTNQIPQVGMTREQVAAQRQQVRNRNQGRELASRTRSQRIRQAVTPASREADRQAAASRRVAEQRRRIAARRQAVATPAAATAASTYATSQRPRLEGNRPQPAQRVDYPRRGPRNDLVNEGRNTY